ncbi:stalk domain-containing protein [Paenibacillus sp. IHBB 10380]|uniref:stalk domain-containing protein n=1 Tax=Paenibacillus sp. IHBB 10380 TaxID=1566358 RepID=UPI000698603A|nr:stalk domain-containing protein [Paenibacillus sp. IHBB 10380]
MVNKDKMKGFVFGVVSTSLILASSAAWASPVSKKINALYNDIKVVVNGEDVQLTGNNEPFMVQNTTYLPLRAVADALDQPVRWDSTTQTVLIGNGATTTNRYEVAGIEYPQEFEAFFSKVQKRVADGDKAGVADLVHYPLNVNSNGKTAVIKTKQQFINEYDQIMTDKVQKALKNQEVQNTFVNYQGVMVGDGEIWFNVSNKDPHTFYIYAINK